MKIYNALIKHLDLFGFATITSLAKTTGIKASVILDVLHTNRDVLTVKNGKVIGCAKKSPHGFDILAYWKEGKTLDTFRNENC